MAETIFNGKASLTAGASLITVKVDIIKYENQLDIRLIDTSNIFTLYVCTISQSDYYVLKRDQDILVDYDRFVLIVASLFHSLSTDRLSATFAEGVLRFIENGEFRNICKLELRFRKPEETQYRRYLGDLLSRMESDNIKLIKENAVLRDKCINGDREAREKMRYLESETADYKRRMEMQGGDMGLLESRLARKEEETAQLSSRIFALETDNSQMKYDLEKFQKDNSQSYKELLRGREEELETALKDIKTANEIIKRLRGENEELRNSKGSLAEKAGREASAVRELTEKLSAATKKLKAVEEKYKELKETSKGCATKMKEFKASNKSLQKNLDNFQNMYSHILGRKIDDPADSFPDVYSAHPESPEP